MVVTHVIISSVQFGYSRPTSYTFYILSVVLSVHACLFSYYLYAPSQYNSPLSLLYSIYRYAVIMMF